MSKNDSGDSIAPENGHWWDGFLIKSVLGKEAQRAIGRLISGVTAIPTAYLEGEAQRIHDNTKGRTLIADALAKKAAEIAVNDPDLVVRTVERLIADGAREQRSREAIGRIAAEELNRNPGSDEKNVDDDWLNKFSRYASDVSSEELQRFWGMILAGEIRTPGSVSLRSLQLISMLDSATAMTFERVAPWILADDLLPLPKVTGIPFEVYLTLQEHDLIIPGRSLSKTFGSVEGSVFSVITLANKFIATSQPTAIEGYKITKAGTELLKLLVKADAADSVKIVADHILEKTGQFLAIGELPKIGDTLLSMYKYPPNSKHPPPEGIRLDLDGSVHEM